MKMYTYSAPFTGIDTIFTDNSEKKELKIQSCDNGHFYATPKMYVSAYQSDRTSSVSFTPEGLNSLREKYNQVHGVPTFLHSLLQCDKSHPELKQLATAPHFYPYFKDEQFLIVPNVPYDPEFESLQHPKAQKLKDAGISLNGWFIHQKLSCMTDESRQLLDELSGDVPPAEQTVLKKLNKHYETEEKKETEHNPKEKDARTIGEIRQDGEYLASILDLNKSHIGMLKNLKEKALLHVKEQYKVGDRDSVDMYFHFPYPEHTTTLHMHIRVNQGFHPLDRAKSFTVNELIEGLSSDKTIDQIILDRQKSNNGRFYRASNTGKKELYDDTPGITVTVNDNNIHRLKQSRMQIERIYSRDDLFDWKKRKL